MRVGRLGRLVVAGLAAGALAGFLAGLIRPRPRGVLPGLTAADLDAPHPAGNPAAPPAGPGGPAGPDPIRVGRAADPAPGEDAGR
jgi:hypothetical protein